MKYIKTKSSYIRNDLESLLLDYDHFFFGIELPKIVDHRFVRFIFHRLLRQFIKIAFYCRIFAVLFETVSIEDDFLIKKRTNGEWPSTITLRKDCNNRLRITKQVFSDTIFNKEKSFFNEYKNNESELYLSDMIFADHNQIYMPFIKQKSLSRLIYEGRISYKESLSLFKVISSELKVLYSNHEFTLIHGDLGLLNIYPIAAEATQNDMNSFCIIDYSDSHFYSIKYD